MRATQALTGVRVLELGSGMAVALAGLILADNGAEVGKIESPDGAGERSGPGHHSWNRGKRSVVLDLRTGVGRAELARLAAGTDVLLCGLDARAMTALGLDLSALHAANPALVSGVISGLGPLAAQWPDVRGDDALVSALVGRMWEVDALSGAAAEQDRKAPIFTAPPVLAYGAGQLAAQGVLAALLRRARDGRGSSVRTSLLQAWTVFMMRHPLLRDLAATEQDLPPTVQRGVELCFLTVRCADGKYIQMCARQDAHFKAWLTALGLTALLDEPRFAGMPLGITTLAALDDLEDMLRARMATRSQAEWMRAFTEDYDVGADPFLTPAEFLDHPQMVDNARVVTIEDPAVGSVRAPGVLVELAATPGGPAGPAPRLGDTTSSELAARFADLAHSSPRSSPPSPPQSGPRRAPLAGVVVLEAAHFVAGPLAGSLLAELGARIIKIEPLAGDPFRRTGAQSVKFLVGKESIALNLKDPAARAVVDALVLRSDVFVHSFRPGVPERLNLGAARLAEINPALLYVNASAYGSRGPQRHRSAFHSTPTALSGAGIIQAGRGNAPVDDSFPDPGGALTVATAVLLGLNARERIGVGQYIETTMLTSAAYVMSLDLTVFPGAVAPPLPDRGQYGRHPLYRLYPTAAGWLFLAALRPREWDALIAVLGAPAWATRERMARAAAAAEPDLADDLAAAFRQRPAREWLAELSRHAVSVGPVSEVQSDSWLAGQGLLTPDDHPAFRAFWRLPPKIDFAGEEFRPGPAAALGEHSRALLAEIGYTEQQIGELVAAGTLGVWPASDAEAAGQ